MRATIRALLRVGKVGDDDQQTPISAVQTRRSLYFSSRAGLALEMA
jgi:hypothetical protein